MLSAASIISFSFPFPFVSLLNIDSSELPSMPSQFSALWIAIKSWKITISKLSFALWTLCRYNIRIQKFCTPPVTPNGERNFSKLFLQLFEISILFYSCFNNTKIKPSDSKLTDKIINLAMFFGNKVEIDKTIDNNGIFIQI